MARPVVLLAYFELDDLPRIVDAIEPAGIPNDVAGYVGSYGINAVASNLVRSVRQGRYAPMFPVQPSRFYERRRLPPLDAASRRAAAEVVTELTQRAAPACVRSVGVARFSAEPENRGGAAGHDLARRGCGDVSNRLAQCLAYLVGSPRLPDVRCRTVEQVQLVNVLCRLVEAATSHVPI